MELSKYCRAYLNERPGLSRDYCLLVAATCRKLCAWAGRQLALEEIDRPLLADWARALLQKDRPATVNGKLRYIRTLLSAAYDDGLIDRPPRRIRRLPEQLMPPEAWTIEEVRQLLAYLSTIPGWVGRPKAADWWISVVATTYWSGCRIGALIRSTVRDYRPGVGLTVRCQKNGRPQWYRLPPSCCQAIERVLPADGLIWPWPMHRRSLFNHFRRYVELSGIRAPKGHHDLFHRLRRTNASYCALEDPSLAQRQLDHSSLEITRRSYIDPTIAPQRSAADVLPDPMPPGLRVVG